MPEPGGESLDRSGKPKKDKVPSVWISFMGRSVISWASTEVYPNSAMPLSQIGDKIRRHAEAA